MLSIFHKNVGLADHAGPDAWNDPDMLEVGRNMTATEDQTEFSLWTNATTTSNGAISASVPGHGAVLYRISDRASA